MNHRLVRSGIGYDVHTFGPKRKLILGGIRIPSLVGLEGHSDADVLLHAVCDALLGAAALGDIGKHFPNTQKRYKNISSIVLLRRVRDLLSKHRYLVGNVDATVVLETPKLAPYVSRMRKTIARALRLSADQISVKATTNEQMGFVGRREGCAAIAIATIYSISGNSGARTRR